MGIFRQFPYSNFHDMNVDEIIKIVKEMLEEWAQYHATWEDWKNGVDSTIESFRQWFNTLDVQEEVNNKINSMVASGELATLMQPYISNAVTNWLAEHITEPTDVVIDSSLTISGAAADAKVTGDRLYNIRRDVTYDMSAIASLFNFNIIQPSVSNENYWMIAAGGVQPQNNFTVRRYAVTPGTTLNISVQDSNSQGKFAFKSSNSGVSTNNVGAVRTEYGTYIMTVPEGATWLFVATNSADTPVVKLLSAKDLLISGPIFAFISNNNVIIKADDSARAYISGQILNIGSWNWSLPIPGSGTYVIIFRNGSPAIVSVTQLKNSDLPICYVYSNNVYALDDNVFTNCPPIDDLYQRQNIPIYVNNKRIWGYEVKPGQNKSYIQHFDTFFKMNNIQGRLPAMVYMNKNASFRNSNIVQLNNEAIAGKSILMIGDSIVKRGYLQNRLSDHVSSLTFIGTQTSNYYNIPCEGYSGKTAKQVLTEATILIEGTTQSIVNPFYDPSLSTGDYGYYCRTQNVQPDMVVINFGLNETSHTEYAAAMRAFIESIYSYAPATKVYVVMPFTRATGAGGLSFGMNREIEIRRCCCESYTFEHCKKVPAWFILVDEYDYNTADVAYGYNNIEIEAISDDTHPSENIGFAKLADMIYNYLGV